MCWLMKPHRSPAVGASDGNLQSLARLARGRACLRHVLVWTGGRPFGRHAEFTGALDLNRRVPAKTTFGLFAAQLAGGGLRGRVSSTSSAGLTTKWCRLRCAKATANAACAAGRPAVSRHRRFARTREGRAPASANRPRRRVSRSSGDVAQYGAIDVWSSPLVTLSRGAGDCGRLRDRQIGCDATGRRRHRQSAHRDHARHHPARMMRWLRRPLAETLDNGRMAIVKDAQVTTGRASSSIATASNAMRTRRCRRCGARPQAWRANPKPAPVRNAARPRSFRSAGTTPIRPDNFISRSRSALYSHGRFGLMLFRRG